MDMDLRFEWRIFEEMTDGLLDRESLDRGKVNRWTGGRFDWWTDGQMEACRMD